MVETDPFEDVPQNLDENEFGFNSVMKGEQVNDESKNYNLFFTTESLLYEIEKNFRGYTKVNGVWKYTSEPIARDEIINQIMNALRSMINPIHMTSSMKSEELAFDLLEKITEIIYTIFDEPTVDESKVEHIANVVDHTLQIFAGHIKDGHGSRFARQIYGNLYHEPNKSNNDKKWWEDFIKFN